MCTPKYRNIHYRVSFRKNRFIAIETVVMVTKVNKQSATPLQLVCIAMDVKVQIANCARSPTSPSIMLKDQKVVSSPTVERVSTRAKLPPLTLDAACDSHPKSGILRQAKGEVQSIMKLLLVEVTQ